MLAFPGVQVLDVVGALEVFNIASRLLLHDRSELGLRHRDRGQM